MLLFPAKIFRSFIDITNEKTPLCRAWLYSTNHKDIGTLYLIFGIILRPRGVFLSFMNALELNGTRGSTIFTQRTSLSRVWCDAPA